jgi:hypothetical protein
MRTDPNPNEIRFILERQRAVMRSDPHRPELADLFEA